MLELPTDAAQPTIQLAEDSVTIRAFIRSLTCPGAELYSGKRGSPISPKWLVELGIHICYKLVVMAEKYDDNNRMSPIYKAACVQACQLDPPVAYIHFCAIGNYKEAAIYLEMMQDELNRSSEGCIALSHIYYGDNAMYSLTPDAETCQGMSTAFINDMGTKALRALYTAHTAAKQKALNKALKRGDQTVVWADLEVRGKDLKAGFLAAIAGIEDWVAQRGEF